MSQNWEHRTISLGEFEQGGIRSMSWEEAQAWCNFVLMRPTSIPSDLEVEKLTMRPEAPPGRPANASQISRPNWTQSNRAAHRAEFIGPKRKLRIKQFLYDYAPPAFDHPSLWKSECVSPFSVGSLIGWLGTDFRKLRAATISLDRTTIEVSVTEGVFRDEELQATCRSLRPAASESRERILTTPFADLSYQSRHREPPIAVPVGYWAHKRLPESLQITALRSRQISNNAPCFGISPPDEYGYRLNSAFVYGDPEKPQETDSVFEHMEDAGRYLRVLVSPSDRAGGVPFPPRRELQQPCSSQILSLKNSDVHHAYYDKRFGQHEAVWQRDGLNIMLIVKPTIWTNMTWFTNLLKEMV